MKFAGRLEQVPPYLFAELERTIARLRAEGVDVVFGLPGGAVRNAWRHGIGKRSD